MSKVKIIGGAAAVALIAGLVSIASPVAAHVPTVTATCTTLTVNAENYEAKPEVKESRLLSPEVPAVPGTPEIPAVYETVVVTPGTPGSPEEGYTRYQYQKQVKGVIQTRKAGEWKNTGTFDWQWYVNVSTQWSNNDVEVLQTGGHSDIFEEHGNTRKQSTHYRYVKNGVTQYVKTKDAVPATPEVTEQRLVSEAIPATPDTPAIPAVYEEVVVQEANASPNTVVVKIGDTVVADEKFGESFNGSYPFPNSYESHAYTVTITAWNDIDGSKGYTKTFTGSTVPCVPEYPGDRVTTQTTPRVVDCDLKTASWFLITYTSVGTLVNGEWVYGEPVETGREPNTIAIDTDKLAQCTAVKVPPTDKPIVQDIPDKMATTGVEEWPWYAAFILVLSGVTAMFVRRRA